MGYMKMLFVKKDPSVYMIIIYALMLTSNDLNYCNYLK